jgi:nitrate/nitrite-specific signal transduction histidine kinase
MKKLIIIIAALFSAVNAVEISSDAQAVNIAGRERMLIMRTLKDSLIIAMHIKYRNPKEDRNRTIAAFEEGMEVLGQYIKEKKLLEDLSRIKRKWEAGKKMLTGGLTKKNAQNISEKATAYRDEVNTFVNSLSDYYGGGAAEVVNHAGRLRMISQALASAYLMKAWGIKEVEEKLHEIMKLFRRSLDYCQNAKETNGEMRPLLKEIEKTYLFFDIMNTADTATPVMVIKKSDRMLKTANDLTGKYVEATKK